MSHIYTDRKRAENSSPEKKTVEPQGPSMDALRSGAAQPTAEQMGHRVDLPDAMRSKMEDAFGADLSAVKLYESQAVADAGAKAMARGADIAFAPGLLDFTSFGGQALLGHEISHVVSQARGEVTGGGFLNDHALEVRADMEGAMAAAGQQIAMPTAAMSSVTAASAAGPMQAKDKDKDKGKSQDAAKAAPLPEQISFDNATSLKGGMGDLRNTTMTVAKLSTPGGPDAVLKTGVNAGLEHVLSQYHNKAGETHATHGGMWGFSAPEARPLTPAEIAAARGMTGRNGTKEKKTLFSSRTAKDRPKDKDEVEDELEHMAIFSMAGGKSRLDPTRKNEPEIAERFRKQGKSAITANPKGKKENADYQRMMGYIAMTDMVTGNSDRVAGLLNYDNWLEDRDAKHASLIDNDLQDAGGLRRGFVGRGDWLRQFIAKVGNVEDASRYSSAQFLANINLDRPGYSDPDPAMNDLFGYDPTTHSAPNAQAGVDQAIADLPRMREEMMRQFMDENKGEKLSEYQEELLERMRITHEYMTNPEMAAVYRRIAKQGVGFSTPKKWVDNQETTEDAEESDAVKTERAGYLQQITDMRKQAEAAAFVPGEKTSDQTFGYRTAAVPEDFDPQTATEDEGLALLYRKIKNPDPNDDAETISNRKRFFAQQRAAQMERQRRKGQG